MRGAWRTALAALLVVGVPSALFLAWTEAGLRPDLERRAVAQLARTLDLMSAEAAGRPLTDSLADRLGELAGLRVTLIGPGGTVLGDSEVAAAALPTLEDHGDRPEVVSARAGGMGWSVRGSRSVALPLFYVAIPHEESVIRAAVPAAEVLRPLDRTRRTALLFAVIALLLLVVLRRPLGLASTRSSGELRRAVRRLARGDFQAPASVRGGPLAGVADDLRDAARALAEREARAGDELAELEAMLDAIDDGVAVVGADGLVRRSNRSFAGWTGRRGLVGVPIATLFRHPGPRHVAAEALTGRPAEAEVMLGTRTANVRAVPFEDGALMIVRDLTSTRRLEGMRRDFVANVSHELKTPLTAVRGFAEPLLGGDVEPRRSSEFVRRILANVDRMQLLVDDLLDLTRIESGGWRPRPEDVHVEAAVQRVWRRMEPLASARSVSLRIEASPGGDVRVQADPDALEQILANLLDNAIRYSPDGGTVRVRAVKAPAAEPAPAGAAGTGGGEIPERDSVRVEVIDQGPGIPSEHVDRVFERFYRVDAGRSRAAGGTGLGLSIVKHLVGAHGGRAGVASELGHGTTAWFELPSA